MMSEPSQRMSIGFLPLTARSSSSNNLETPRTGGGLTARSGGERGTPRDAQRLALGERPSRESIQRRSSDIPCAGAGSEWGCPTVSGAPILSPRAHSIAYSSEPWSRTPSSQGDSLSSRSRFDHSARLDSLSYSAPCEEVHGMGAMSAASVANAQAQAHESSRPYHLDTQKSLEVIRFVIQKENQKLKDLVQQARDGLSEVEKEFTSMPCRHELCQHLKGTQPGPRVLEWRLEHIGGQVKALCSAGGSGDPLEFKFSDGPGLELRLSFQADRSPDDLQKASPSGGCLLKVEVAGPCWSQTEITTRLCLDVSVEQGNVVNQHRMDLGMVRGVGQASHVLTRHMAELLASGSVVCRVEIKAAHCAVGPLNLYSEWPSST